MLWTERLSACALLDDRMSHKCLIVILSLALSGAALLPGQVPLNQIPSRVVGQPQLQLTNGNPNLVEGREMYSPQALVVDSSTDPPILYVADTGNNRVLAWRNASQFANGAPADFVIGQKDSQSTFPGGPGTTASVGLNRPTGLAVRGGDLYVADSGNNRILRYPKPGTQQDQFPDMVIGQPNFNSRQANEGGTQPGKATLALSTSSVVYRCQMAFDSDGNLWVSDGGNNRVLRFPVSSLAAGESEPEANLILGQLTYEAVQPALSVSAASQQIKDRLQVPDGLAFDAAGNLFVADGLSRVLVFEPPFRDTQLAKRLIGVVSTTLKAGQTPPTQIQIDRTLVLQPQGLVMIGGSSLGVVDGLTNRILIFPAYSQWPAEDTMYSPQADYVVGQSNDFVNFKPNHGQPEASENTLAGPAAAVMQGSELFVADAGNNRVVVLPAQGPYFGPAARVLGQDGFAFGSANLIEGREFAFTITTQAGNYADAGVAVDQTTDTPHLYVADTYNNRVLGFNDLRQVKPGDRADIVIGQPDMFRALCNYPFNDVDKPTASGLCRPAGLLVDTDGNLWVADSANGRVLRFPKPFEQPQGTMPEADLVLGQTGFNSKITDPTARTMASPYGLTFAGDAGLLVSDPVHNRVLLFPKNDGGYEKGEAAVKVFGQPDFTSALVSTSGSAEDNRMRGPRHISFDTDGRLYVADTGNNRVLIFDQLVNTTPADARAAVTLGGLAGPRAVFVSPQTGEIWVTNTNSATVLRYPRFDQLPFSGFQASQTLMYAASSSLALTQDREGDLVLADAANRVAIYYPGIKAVNAAHQVEGRALTPGVVAYLYPQTNGTFGGETVKVTDLPNPLPWPVELGDIQVLVNDTAAPLSYVSPSQINVVVPAGAPTSGTAEFLVMRKSTGQILATGPVPMNVASPGLFTVNDNGTGQVVASNQDGSRNSATNPAGWGTVISLFGTGQGPIAGGPADGDAPKEKIPTGDRPRVIIGTCFVDDPACGGDASYLVYSGLAPGLVGTWQIDVKIPNGTAPSATVPVVISYKSQYSNAGDPKHVATTIAVKQ